MLRTRLIKHDGAFGGLLSGKTEVHIRRRMQPDPAMAMFVVLSRGERVQDISCMVNRGEALWLHRPVLEALEQ